MTYQRKKKYAKTSGLALDLVEEGDISAVSSSAEATKIAKVLPAQVTKKMLYQDTMHIAWPSIVELTLTQLASMVDLMMVGKLGPWALSAVGLTTQPKFLLMTMFMAMNIGATAMVARYKGAGEQEKANKVLHQAILLTVVLSIAASILGFIFSKQLILFMGASDEASLQGGTIYLQIQMIGFVFMALTTTATAVLRGIGDSRTAMVYNLTANIVNVIFNYILIYGHFGFPRLEVAGASLATVLGQFVAFILAAKVLLSNGGYLRLKIKEIWKPDRNEIASILKIGIPAMIEQFVMRAGMIIYTKTVASLGTVAYATHQVCMNIHAMSFMIGQGFAVSATSLVGQSLGKKRTDMAQFYASSTQRVGMVFAVILGGIFFFFGRDIVALYSDDLLIIEQGGNIMRVVAFVVPLATSQFILAGALRGAGDTKATAVISFITMLLIRPIIAIIAINVFNLGLWGAWIALLADQVIRSFLVFIRYLSGKWKVIQI